MMAEDTAPSFDARFPRRWQQNLFIVPMARALMRYHRVHVHGMDNVPQGKPVIFVGKHPQSYLYLEIVMMGVLTFWDYRRPPFRVLEKTGTSQHKLPVIGWLRRNVGCIPATEEAARGALQKGESLLIFPGGTRELLGKPDVLRWTGRRGFAKLAALEQVPVVPFAIIGADQQHLTRVPVGRRSNIWLPLFPMPTRLDYWFGKPIMPPAQPNDESVAAFADTAHNATRNLLADGLLARHERRLWRR